MSTFPAPPPGWYTDPADATGQRFWDGRQWTNQCLRMSPQPAPAGPGQMTYVAQPANGMAVAALVSGIVAVALGFIPVFFAFTFALGIVGFVLGVVARNRAIREPVVGRQGMATAAIIVSAAAIAMGFMGLALTTFVVDEVQNTAECLEEATTAEELNDCHR